MAINVSTSNERMIYDVTYEVDKLLQHDKVKDGIYHLFLTRPGASLVLWQRNDAMLMDLVSRLLKQYQDSPYVFDHVSLLLGQTVDIPVTNLKMGIDQLQRVLLIELDGPKQRTIEVKLVENKELPW